MTTADTIFIGGPIVPMNPKYPEAEALAVVSGRIETLGASSPVMQLRGENTQLINLHGQALLPGFIEAHVHPLYSALSSGYPVIDIRPDKAHTGQPMVEIIRQRAAAARPGEFLWFLGMDPSRVPDLTEPTKAELNAWAPNNPLVVQIFSFHSAYINSAAARVC